MAADSRTGGGEDGYAVVDALVAMTIIAFAVVAGMDALSLAARSSQAAAEVQDAKTLLSRLADAEPKSFEGSAGQTAGFNWAVQTLSTGDTALIEVCRRAVSVVALRSGRHFDLTTLTTCPSPIAG